MRFHASTGDLRHLHRLKGTVIPGWESPRSATRSCIPTREPNWPKTVAPDLRTGQQGEPVFLLTRKSSRVRLVLGGLGVCVWIAFGVVGTFSDSYSDAGPGGVFEVSYERPNPARTELQHNLGWFWIDTSIHNRKTVAGSTVYDVDYEFDAYGRRIVSDAIDPPDAVREKHVIFVGGSFAMGHGVSGDKTLPARLQLQLPDHRVYNYAKSGHSPSHVRRLLDVKDLRDEIPEKRGIMIYSYIDDQLKRVAITPSVTSWSKGNFPYYTVAPNGSLHYGGLYRHSMPRRFLVHRSLAAVGLARLAIVDRLFASPADTLDLATRLLADTARAYRRQFDSNEFYVMFHPDNDTTQVEVSRALHRLGVKTIDLGLTEAEFDRKSLCFEHDGHPNDQGNEVLATHLAEHLRARGIVDGHGPV